MIALPLFSAVRQARPLSVRAPLIRRFFAIGLPGKLACLLFACGVAWAQTSGGIPATDSNGNVTFPQNIFMSGTSPIPGTNTTQGATTKWVQTAIDLSMATVPLSSITGGTYSFAGLGSGAVVSFTVASAPGPITSIGSIFSGGVGYAVGDLITIPYSASVLGNADAVLRVATVSGTAVASLTILYGGTGYHSGTNSPTDLAATIRFTFTLAGVLASNATFIMPNGTALLNSNQWIFANNTTGAFTTKVFISNGSDATTGNGVVLPQGTSNSTSTFVWTDGSTDIWLTGAGGWTSDGTTISTAQNVKIGTTLHLAPPLPASADNTAVLNAGITAVCAAGGGELNLPSGRYAFTPTVSLACSNFTLSGAGPGATILDYSASGLTTRAIDTNGYSNISIRDLSITAGTTAGELTAGRVAIVADGDTTSSSNISIENVYVYNVPSGGIGTSGATGISKVRVHNAFVDLVGEHGIYFSGCASCSIDQVVVTRPHQNTSLASNAGAIKVSGGNSLTLTNANLDASANDGGFGLDVEGSALKFVGSAIKAVLGGTNQIGLRIDVAGATLGQASVDGGAGFSGNSGVDFRSNCSGSVVVGLQTSGTIQNPVIEETGATSCGLLGGVLAATTAGYEVAFGASTTPFVANAIVTTGSNGIDFGTSTSGQDLNNVILTGGTLRSLGSATTPVSVVPTTTSLFPTLAGNNAFTGATTTFSNNSLSFILENGSGGTKYLDANAGGNALGLGGAHGTSNSIYIRPGGSASALYLTNSQPTLTGTGACVTGSLSAQGGGHNEWGVVTCGGTTGAATLTISPGVNATHGWVCIATDITQHSSTNLLLQSDAGTTVGSCTLTAAAIISGDVISFAALPQ